MSDEETAKDRLIAAFEMFELIEQRGFSRQRDLRAGLAEIRPLVDL